MEGLHSSWYSPIAWVLRMGIAAALGHQLLAGDAVGALAMALFLVVSFAHLMREDRLPNVFDLLVSVSALLNGLGFVFDLYRGIPLYDEVAHAITIFAITLAAYVLIYRERGIHTGWREALALFSFGVMVGSIWEIAEWTTGRLFSTEVVFGLSDAITDLIANSVGALAAAILVSVVGSRRRT